MSGIHFVNAYFKDILVRRQIESIKVLGTANLDKTEQEQVNN